MQTTTLRDVLTSLGTRSLKVHPRGRGTAKMEIDFIAATGAGEYLDRPAIAASVDGETLVLVQSSEDEKWLIYAAFVTMPF